MAFRQSSIQIGFRLPSSPHRERPRPRLAPSTKRSRLTVDTILQAFTGLYAQYGYDEITTTLVAERAGVSVGALYQYFPNKEAIAVALFEETSSRVALRIRDTILEDINESLEETVAKTLAILLSCYRENRAVLIDLLDASPPLRAAVRHLSVVDLIERSSRIYLEQHLDELGTGASETTRYFMGAAVKGCLRDYILNPPKNLPDETFVAELTKILVLYAKS
ncbi:MAG: TetR/AcrR family transcriptional regulator [Candidatus Binatia bacterium]